MPLAFLKLPPAVRRALLALQLIPLIILASMAGLFWLNNPSIGFMPWLGAALRVSHQAYAAITFLFASIYAYGLRRFYKYQCGDIRITLAMAAPSAAVLAHAIMAWYWQLVIEPDRSISFSLLWLLLAISMYIIAWFCITFQAWLWQIGLDDANRADD